MVAIVRAQAAGIKIEPILCLIRLSFGIRILHMLRGETCTDVLTFNALCSISWTQTCFMGIAVRRLAKNWFWMPYLYIMWPVVLVTYVGSLFRHCDDRKLVTWVHYSNFNLVARLPLMETLQQWDTGIVHRERLLTTLLICNLPLARLIVAYIIDEMSLNVLYLRLWQWCPVCWHKFILCLRLRARTVSRQVSEAAHDTSRVSNLPVPAPHYFPGRFLLLFSSRPLLHSAGSFKSPGSTGLGNSGQFGWWPYCIWALPCTRCCAVPQTQGHYVWVCECSSSQVSSDAASYSVITCNVDVRW
jgi:hypothetical protein